jgi:hypothetical protein
MSGAMPRPAQTERGDEVTRNEAITAIRAALKRRSGKSWSLTGGRGTAYGWIVIDAPPSRRTWRFHNPNGGTNPEDYTTEVNDCVPDCGHTGPEERRELQALLGLSRPVHFQGESIPASSDYYFEYVARANGTPPIRIGKPYWD